jgi:hypothetical protein
MTLLRVPRLPVLPDPLRRARIPRASGPSRLGFRPAA